MKCLICGNAKNFLTVHSYNEPDRYEHWVGIEDVNRSWVRCMKCGFYMQIRNYELPTLEQIYKSGYRDEKFRFESIEEAFNRINAIENNENESRYIWLATNIKYDDNKNVLDIGSGIGVFPNILKRAGYNVTCVEENETSINFIYEQLGVKCFQGIDKVVGTYDMVTVVHVFEHIEDVESFLMAIKGVLRTGGKLFVEVPDDSEFTYLDKNNDEFNSCHVSFYSMGSLYRVLESNGFTVIDMHLEKTKQRNLSRVMCLAINQ